MGEVDKTGRSSFARDFAALSCRPFRSLTNASFVRTIFPHLNHSFSSQTCLSPGGTVGPLHGIRVLLIIMFSGTCLTQVEVDEVLRFVGDVGAKVAADDAVPGWVVLLVELLLDEGSDVLDRQSGRGRQRRRVPGAINSGGRAYCTPHLECHVQTHTVLSALGERETSGKHENNPNIIRTTKHRTGQINRLDPGYNTVGDLPRAAHTLNVKTGTFATREAGSKWE